MRQLQSHHVSPDPHMPSYLQKQRPLLVHTKFALEALGGTQEDMLSLTCDIPAREAQRIHQHVRATHFDGASFLVKHLKMGDKSRGIAELKRVNHVSTLGCQLFHVVSCKIEANVCKCPHVFRFILCECQAMNRSFRDACILR